MATDKPIEKLTLSDEEWRARLTDQQYSVCRLKGTEPAFTGEYNETKTAGTYVCAGCGQDLFSSGAKFDSGCGWPSFTQPIEETQVDNLSDHSFGMVRTEVLCSRRDSHLGHVFPDGPAPTGLRYCMNSLSLKLEPEE